MNCDFPHQELVDALRENTAAVTKLNELLAPELKRSAVVREAELRTQRLRSEIRETVAKHRAEARGGGGP